MPSVAGKITKFTKREIESLFQQARRVLRHSGCLILLAARQKDFGRILIVTSRKVGNAPERNKLRRRIKSIFYEEKLFEYPFDGVIILYKKAVGFDFDQLKDLLTHVYKKEAASNENATH